MAVRQNQARNAQLVVLGMHRSGTSLLTRLLNLCGAYFGPDSMHTGHNEENPKGFWERKDVRALNDLVLKAQQADWDRPVRFDPKQLSPETRDAFESGATRLAAEFQDHLVAVIKEPRMGLTYPLWHAHFSRPVFVWIHRHPLEIAASLLKRNQFPHAYGLALWEWYTQKMLQASKDSQVIHTSHAAFIENPYPALQEVVDQCQQLDVEGLTLPTPEVVEGFVSKKLHRAKLSSSTQMQSLSVQQSELWQWEQNAPHTATAPPANLSPNTLLYLEMGHTASRTTLEQLEKLTQKQHHLEQERRQLRNKNTQIQKALTQEIQQAQKLQRRLSELERSWATLKQSKLWKLGLVAHGIRKAFKRKPPHTALADKNANDHQLHKPITIIIPIFNAVKQVIPCLQSVLRHTFWPHRLLLIDDASTQQELSVYLDEIQASFHHVFLIRHQQNQGYTASVNEGIKWASSDHVVLLNSDTLLPPAWLEKLHHTAHLDSKIATVTALSNAAGAFSIPQNHAVNNLPDGYDVAAYARLVTALSQNCAPEVPTGNGFCMYIRREALEDVGLFDAEAFPRGYGEENDFCMRATQAGYGHRIADSCFVYHHRNASFGKEKESLIAASKHILAQRWPGYKPKVTQWLQNDPLDSLRAQLSAHIAKNLPLPQAVPNQQTPVLYILHDGGGGTKLTSMELLKNLPSAMPGFMLLTGLDRWRLLAWQNNSQTTLQEWDFPESWQIGDTLNQEKKSILRSICSHFGIRVAHVRHFLGNAPEILKLLQQQALKVVLSFHDFYTICPNIQLIDKTGRFCAGQCQTNETKAAHQHFEAKQRPGDCRLAGNWFRSPPYMYQGYVHAWRQRLHAALPHINAAVTTSQSAKELLCQHFDQLAQLPFEVIEHGRDLDMPAPVGKAPGLGQIPVVCFGALNYTKGLGLIEALVTLDQQNPRFHFHLLGNVAGDWQPPETNVTLHGAYKNEELYSKLKTIGPSLALIPSLWPETYCHTLTESWSMGIPTICSNLGTLRERVEQHKAGWLADPQQPHTWYQLMLKLVDQQAEYENVQAHVRVYRAQPVSKMVTQYVELYQHLTTELPQSL